MAFLRGVVGAVQSLDHSTPHNNLLTHNLHTQDEVSLLRGVVGAVQSLDPDIIVGWDIQKESIGYLVDRCVLLCVIVCAISL